MVKYLEQEKFIVKMVVLKWKIGISLNKLIAYDLLVFEFDHENKDDQMEWEKKMKIYLGSISPSLLQW